MTFKEEIDKLQCLYQRNIRSGYTTKLAELENVYGLVEVEANRQQLNIKYSNGICRPDDYEGRVEWITLNSLEKLLGDNPKPIFMDNNFIYCLLMDISEFIKIKEDLEKFNDKILKSEDEKRELITEYINKYAEASSNAKYWKGKYERECVMRTFWEYKCSKEYKRDNIWYKKLQRKLMKSSNNH